MPQHEAASKHDHCSIARTLVSITLLAVPCSCIYHECHRDEPECIALSRIPFDDGHGLTLLMGCFVSDFLIPDRCVEVTGRIEGVAAVL